MKRRIFAAVVFCVLTFGVHAQIPLLPPTFMPTDLPSITPILIQQTVTALSASTTAADPTASSNGANDSLRAAEPLDIVVFTDVLFPVGFAFKVVFRHPEAGISALTMTAEQAGWVGQTRDIDLDNVYTDENGLSALSYFWEVTEDPPRLFEPLTIIWSITPRGQASQSINVETVFADDRVKWGMIGQDTDTQFAAADSRTTAAVVSAQLNSLSELLEAGRRRMPRLNTVIFPQGIAVDPCINAKALTGAQTTVEVPCAAGMADTLYARAGWDVKQVMAASNIRTLVTERIIPAAYPLLFASAEVPEWFKTGVIAYLAGSYGPSDLELVRAASRNNSMLPSLDIIPSDPAYTQWRAQSIGTVIYMASQIGVAPMLGILRHIDEGETLGDLWLARSGQALSALNAIWRSWIFSPRAESAYNMPPDLGPTLTLVPTRTPTFTPTSTLTLTPSATWTDTTTPSLTPTPTPSTASGFAPPTAAPTHTPTATSNPTITPLPAVGFTLERELEESPASPDASVAIVALSAIAVLGAVFVLLTRWRK